LQRPIVQLEFGHPCPDLKKSSPSQQKKENLRKKWKILMPSLFFGIKEKLEKRKETLFSSFASFFLGKKGKIL
jgi:hypothetical protein